MCLRIYSKILKITVLGTGCSFPFSVFCKFYTKKYQFHIQRILSFSQRDNSIFVFNDNNFQEF